MKYTPVELRHVRAGRALFGYKRAEIDRVIEDVADSFEEVWRERGELADKLEDLEQTLESVKQRESLLATTLVSAERAAGEARELAKREAEMIVAEAHQESRSIMRSAQTERERLFAEARRIETLLRAALGMVEETAGGSGSAPSSAPTPAPVLEAAPLSAADAPAPVREWPKREDTREFHAVSAPEETSIPEPAKLPPIAEPETGEESGGWTSRDFAWG